MKRPRLALWIKWHRLKWQRPWYCPNWLWRWAVRRVDRYYSIFDPEEVEDCLRWNRSHRPIGLTGKRRR